jgi:hypothetical protein
MKLHLFFNDLLDRVLKIHESDAIVSQIKENTNNKIDQVTASLKESGRLQRKVMNKTTTTYYIAKASGVLR